MNILTLFIVAIIFSVISSIITARIITIKYFDVLDGYAKEILKDTINLIRDATLNK